MIFKHNYRIKTCALLLYCFLKQSNWFLELKFVQNIILLNCDLSFIAAVKILDFSHGVATKIRCFQVCVCVCVCVCVLVMGGVT